MATSPSLAYHASDGAAYQVFLGRWTELLAPVFLDFARMSGDGDVLDVGCGTGSLTAVGTFAASLSETARQVIKSAVRAAFLCGRPDGPRSLTATAWAVRGIVCR